MLIEAEGLVKNYGPVEVIKGISFTLDKPGILGLLGPNGAGKTTVMRMLAGYHLPDSGFIKINGKIMNDAEPELKNSAGYLPENVPLYGDMTPSEYLFFMAEIRMIPKHERKSAVEKAVESCGLGSRSNQRIDTLSRGYRQRAGLAQAIVHDPDILILDEPLTGLDPGQIAHFRALIKELGKTKGIVFSTHILQEAEYLCTDYIVLNRGSVAARGRMESSGDLSGGQNNAGQHTDLEAIFAGISGENENDQA